jgi:hypothetical protein
MKETFALIMVMKLLLYMLSIEGLSGMKLKPQLIPRRTTAGISHVKAHLERIGSDPENKGWGGLDIRIPRRNSLGS